VIIIINPGSKDEIVTKLLMLCRGLMVHGRDRGNGWLQLQLALVLTLRRRCVVPRQVLLLLLLLQDRLRIHGLLVGLGHRVVGSRVHGCNVRARLDVNYLGVLVAEVGFVARDDEQGHVKKTALVSIEARPRVGEARLHLHFQDAKCKEGAGECTGPTIGVLAIIIIVVIVNTEEPKEDDGHEVSYPDK
jgi:hypothetical protein